MATGDYTPSEVAWLLSMTHGEALSCDSHPPDSWPDLLSSDAQMGHSGGIEEGGELLVVLRWTDVHRAKKQVQGSIDDQVMVLRSAGYTQEEIGQALGRSQQTVSRQWRASIEEILAELQRTLAA